MGQSQLKRDLGFSDDEAPDSASWWSARMDPEDRERAAVGLERHREDPAQPYDEILRYRHKNGSIVWVRCRGIIIRDDANRPIRMLGAHTDVTALKAIETELGGRNTELSSQNEELQDFTALVAHELRAPLRGVLALMHELDEDHSEVLDDDTRELIAMAIERVERLQRSVNGLLDYARFGGNTASKTSVALDQIVLECLDELNVRHAATVEFDADLPPLRADRACRPCGLIANG